MMKKTGRTSLTAIGTALALPALTSISISAAAIADPPPGEITIVLKTISGSGCADGNVDVRLSEDNMGFSIWRKAMRVETGGGADPADAQKSCQIGVAVSTFQSGKPTYSIRPAESSGSAHLESGASGALTTRAHFHGTPEPPPRTDVLLSPFSGAWLFTAPDEFPPLKPCHEERLFNISTELRIDPGTSDKAKTSHMTAGGEAAYKFTWKRCPNP